MKLVKLLQLATSKANIKKKRDIVYNFHVKKFRNVKKLLSLLFLVCFIFVFSSCKNPVEEYGDTVIKTYKSTQQFGKEVELKQLQESIKAFYAAHGKYPKNLEEISNFAGLNLDNDKYDYDSSTGIIKLKK